MALQEQKLVVRLAGGIETKSDPKTTPTTKLLGLVNGIFTRGLSISKRKGYSALSTRVLGQPTPYLLTQGLASRVDEIVLVADDHGHSYLESAEAWSRGERVYSVAQSDTVLVKSPSTQTMGDYATCDGVGIVAWEDSRGGVYFAVVDDSSGHVIQGPTQLSATGERPRCVRSGERLHVLWAEASTGELWIMVITPSAPDSYDKSNFPRILIGDLVTTAPGFDAVYAPQGQPTAAALVAWNSVDGIRVGWLDPSGVLGTSSTHRAPPITITGSEVNGVTQGPTLAVNPFSQRFVGVAWALASESYAVTVDVGDDPLEPQASPTALGVADVSNLTCAWRPSDDDTAAPWLDVYLEVRDTYLRNSTVTRKIIEQGGDLIADSRVTRGACLASKAWTDPPDGGERTGTYVTIVHDVPLFAVYLTLRHTGECVARTLPGIAGHTPGTDAPPDGSTGGGGLESDSLGPPIERGHLPSVIADGDRVYRWCAGFRTLLEAINSDQFTEAGLTLVRLAFDDASSFQFVNLGRSLYLGAACPLLYDGAGWLETDPHYAPDWEEGEVLHSNSNTTDGAITAGTRAYKFVYEYTLATGELIVGGESKPYVVQIVNPSDTTTIAVPTLRITRMSSLAPSPSGRVDARIGVFRTIDGDTSVYYRCSSLDPAAVGYMNGYLRNSTAADTATFIDGMDDDVLQTQEPLYTNGGILSNDPRASTAVLAAGKNRLYTVDPSNGSTVRYSQEQREGYAIEWPDDLRLTVDLAGGDVTGLAVLDDALVIFKRSSVYFVAGPGPLANPDAGGGWSTPVLITTDAGCLSQRSIATTPAGVVFQSAKGIYLLDRSRQVSYVGAPVEAYHAQTVSRARLVEDTTQIRFLTAEGSTLLWDYFFDQWSTFGNHEGIDATLVDDTYTYLRTDGRVFREVETHSDAGVSIALDIETAWIHLQEHLQGFQRIWHLLVLGNWKSPHTQRMQDRLDYQANWSALVPFAALAAGGAAYGAGPFGAGPYGGTPAPPYQWRFHIGRKCEAIQFRFRDHEAYGVAGASFEINELLITGGVKRNAYKLPAARSA